MSFKFKVGDIVRISPNDKQIESYKNYVVKEGIVKILRTDRRNKYVLHIIIPYHYTWGSSDNTIQLSKNGYGVSKCFIEEFGTKIKGDFVTTLYGE